MNTVVPGEGAKGNVIDSHKELIGKTMLVNRLLLAIPITFGLMFILGLYFMEDWLCSIGLIGSITCIIFVAAGLYNNKKKFVRKFRETVVIRVVQWKYPGVVYEPFSYIVPKEIWMSGLIEMIPNHNEGDNYFCQKLSGYTVEFANAYGLRQTTRYRVSPKGLPRSSTSAEYLIDGLFYKFTLRSYFKTDVIIWQDRERSLLKLFQQNPESLFDRFIHVEMPDKSFEKEFEVYAKRPSDAFEVVTPELMATLLDIHDYFGKKVQVSLMANNIYVRVDCGTDFFKPSIILSGKGAEIDRIERQLEKMFYVPEKLGVVINRMGW